MAFESKRLDEEYRKRECEAMVLGTYV